MSIVTSNIPLKILKMSAKVKQLFKLASSNVYISVLEMYRNWHILI